MVEKQHQTNSLEHSLIARAGAGEREAFDELFTQHKDRVYACLWHLLDGDSDLVEEAVGNVFLSAFRNLRRFRGEASLATWLYRIAVNEAHARKRQQRRWRLLDLLSRHVPHAVADTGVETTDPAEYVVQTEEGRRLWQAVRALPEPYRTPLVLRYMSGMESAEIAETLRRPAGTIRYQLSRATQILRERLGSEWQK